MPIFKLVVDGGKIESGKLIHAHDSNLELEKHLENWLENSPWAIAQETLLIIGRQISASGGMHVRFPDLLALDKDGFVTIIELKKGRTPREVVAQLLEYGAWAEKLDDERIATIAQAYWKRTEDDPTKNLSQMFMDAFETETLPAFNQRQRLYIVAEEITDEVASVCRYLRTIFGVDISCVSFSVYETASHEILVDTEVIVGMEDVRGPTGGQPPRWSGDKSVREVIHDAVLEYTDRNGGKTFSPKDIKELVLRDYPDFKTSNVGAQIIADCVNHTSRHHYPGGKDFYWWVEKGKYRLFDPAHDRILDVSDT